MFITSFFKFIQIIDVEKKVLTASAQVNAELGAPLIIHPGRHHDAPREIVKFLQEVGADLDKTVMSHLDSKR